jgi:phenylpropionate dioxygenase-like ring-hydroxylating dioxygenase large terminal subunit
MFLEFGRATKSVNEASSLPPKLYTDPAVFEREQEKVFLTEWMALARSDDLPNAGDFATYDFFDAPIVVTRDEAGNVNAFSNVCLHRGCPIAQGKGHAEGGTLVCPYHRWTYGLDGRVKGAPLMHKARRFNRSRLRLPTLKAEEWQGWIFVNANPDAQSLQEPLEALSEKLAPYGLEEMKIATTLTFDSPWNWKIMVENFMESYHHIGAHYETLQQSHPGDGTYVESMTGPFALLENPPKETTTAPFWAACVFPSHLFALSRTDPPYGFWYEMHIGHHDHFDLSIHLLAHDALASDEDFVKDSEQMIRAVHEEDIAVCEGVWKGIQSRYYTEGRLSHLEEANWRFHNFLRERMEL